MLLVENGVNPPLNLLLHFPMKINKMDRNGKQIHNEDKMFGVPSADVGV